VDIGCGPELSFYSSYFHSYVGIDPVAIEMAKISEILNLTKFRVIADEWPLPKPKGFSFGKYIIAIGILSVSATIGVDKYAEHLQTYLDFVKDWGTKYFVGQVNMISKTQAKIDDITFDDKIVSYNLLGFDEGYCHPEDFNNKLLRDTFPKSSFRFSQYKAGEFFEIFQNLQGASLDNIKMIQNHMSVMKTMTFGFEVIKKTRVTEDISYSEDMTIDVENMLITTYVNVYRNRTLMFSYRKSGAATGILAPISTIVEFAHNESIITRIIIPVHFFGLLEVTLNEATYEPTTILSRQIPVPGLEPEDFFIEVSANCSGLGMLATVQYYNDAIFGVNVKLPHMNDDTQCLPGSEFYKVTSNINYLAPLTEYTFRLYVDAAMKGSDIRITDAIQGRDLLGITLVIEFENNTAVLMRDYFDNELAIADEDGTTMFNPKQPARNDRVSYDRISNLKWASNQCFLLRGIEHSDTVI